jgi:hypothetical protein
MGGALGAGPNTLGVLQAMQGLILGNVLVGGVSPWAPLSAADAMRFGVTAAVFIGRPKDFKDVYLPQCCLWAPEHEEARQPVEVVGFSGRVYGTLEVTVQAFVDVRTDWYAGEQTILAIRDALWPVVLRHRLLGGAAGVTGAEAREGRGLCYEQVTGVEYRCYELFWRVEQQWRITGGVVA